MTRAFCLLAMTTLATSFAQAQVAADRRITYPDASAAAPSTQRLALAAARQTLLPAQFQHAIPSLGEGLPQAPPQVLAPLTQQIVPLPDVSVAPDSMNVPQPEVDPGSMTIPSMGDGILPKPPVQMPEQQIISSEPVPLPVATPSPAAMSYPQPGADANNSAIPAMGDDIVPKLPATSVVQEAAPQAQAPMTVYYPPPAPASTTVAVPASAALHTVSMDAHKGCQDVRPGDVVHFALRIQGAEAAHHVFTHLEMALNGHAQYREADLPLPMNDGMGGGGLGVRDTADLRVYHFRFTVPDVATGVYRTTGIDVRAAFRPDSADPGVSVPLDRRSRDEVRGYCLAVFGTGGQRPLVTDFKPEPVERSAGNVVRPLLP